MPEIENKPSEEHQKPRVVEGEIVFPERDIGGAYSSVRLPKELREHIDRLFDDVGVERTPIEPTPITVEGRVIRTITEDDK